MLNWTDNTFSLGDTRFRVGLRAAPEPGEFWMPNPRELIDQYVKLVATLRPRNILELGIYQGASVAFLSLLAKPRKYVAVEIRPRVPRRLMQWLDSRGLRGTVRPYFGVDQADGSRLRSIVESEFDEPLDLIIDDASHRLGPTRASFNTLFPYLRVGGVYVIEDWAARHEIERAMLDDPAPVEPPDRAAAGGPVLDENSAPLTYLLFETVLATAYTDAISEIQLRRDWLAVTRGPAQIEAGTFNVSDCYEALGRALLAREL